MELIFSNYSDRCCPIGCLNWNLAEKSFSSSRYNLCLTRRVGSIHSGQNFNRVPLRLENFKHLNDPKKNRRRGFKLFGSINSDVIVGNEGLGNVSEREDSCTKVLVPGLPDGPTGESSISSCYWKWKPKFNVHYEKSGSENVDSPPVLFLPGFGVGSFHYEKQLKDLGREYRVWAVDFLGQGMSLPVEDPAPLSKKGSSEETDSMWGFGEQSEPWADELVYSIDLWKDQVRYFVEEVIGEPVYIVGNSLGGFVALYFAAFNPHLVKGVTLLNATPFWGFLPNPIKSPRLARIFPWAGTFPLPATVRKLTEIIWQKISDPRSIGEVLKQVYVDHTTNVDKVFTRILEITEHPAAAASFASIMCAPRGQLSFQEALSRSKINGIPICLMYGKEDPWVKPIWGFQVKRQVPEAPYYEISPAGHCPHDEVPEVVNYLLRGWIKTLESQGSVPLPLVDDPEHVQYSFSRRLEYIRDGSRKSVEVRFVGTKSDIWNRISSFIRFHTTNLDSFVSNFKCIIVTLVDAPNGGRTVYNLAKTAKELQVFLPAQLWDLLKRAPGYSEVGKIRSLNIMVLLASGNIPLVHLFVVVTTLNLTLSSLM